MVPNLGQEARHFAPRTARGGKPPHTSLVNSNQLGLQSCHTPRRRDGDRARQTQRKRDNRGRSDKMVMLRSPDQTAPLRRRFHLTDRMTYSYNGDAQVHRYTHREARLLLRHRQGDGIQESIAHDDNSSKDGAAVQPDSVCVGQKDEAEHVNNDEYGKSIDMDDFADLFGPGPPLPLPPQQPVSIRPVQHRSTQHMPLNSNLQAPLPVQPATRREPIRIINTIASCELDIDIMKSTSAVDSPVTSTAKASEIKKHPINRYRGNDPIKKRVQNKKLQLILSDRPLPKPRKNVDRVVLKCTGKQEFR